MSSSRQTPEGPFVRSYAVTHPSGTVVPPQPPGWDHLLYAASGVMTVVTPAGRWVVPPTRAVWVPSGTDHRIEIAGRARLRNLYFEAGPAPSIGRPRALTVSALLRELVLRAVKTAPLYPSNPIHCHLAALIRHEMEELPEAALELAMPRDQRAVAVAEALLSDPGNPVGLDQLAHAAGASRRSIERLFQAETDMALAQWRTRLRLVAALRLLAEGATVAAAAAATGYATPSAFVAMFRRQLGTTPSRYFRGSVDDR